VQLGQGGRFVFKAQVLFCRLQVRVARTAKPDVGFGVGFFCGQLGNGFTGALGRHVDLDALALFKSDGDHAAPSGLGRTDDVDFTVLGLNACADQGQARDPL